MSKRYPTFVLLLIVTTFFESVFTNGEVIVNNSTHSSTARSQVFKNGLSRSINHVFTQCTESEDFFWCFKVQAAKLLGRALRVQNINVVDGFSIVRKTDFNDTVSGRASGGNDLNLSNRDMENLSMKSLDALLFERFHRFVQSRQVQLNLPRMLTFGERNSQELLHNIMSYVMSLLEGDDRKVEGDSEGRKKKDEKKYLGMFIAAVMLKAAILKMAYHSIAIIAGKALIVGKIALIISAIIGLKKLVSGEGGEKTTYEIVKHPQIQQSHTYSSSHAGEYEGGHESGSGGSYHRSIDDEMMMQDKAYHAWIPTTKIS